MKKILLVIFSFLFLVFSFVIPAYAVDLTVNFESDPLFSETNWLPGQSETKWVTVTNNNTDDKTVIVEAYNETKTEVYLEDLADVLELTINDGTSDVYGGSLGTKYLTDFYGETELTLTILLAGHSVTYDFTVALADSVGNPWQSRDTGFDLRVGFYGVAVAPTPTPAPGEAGGGCSATTPSATTLSIAGISENSVSLSWTEVSPVTHYLIAYGTDPGIYIYGNPNVGNVNNYTVRGLSGGETYYFVVRGVNDCAPGPYSNEVSGTPSGGGVTGPAEGFVPILGEATESAELEGTAEEMFLGEATEAKGKSVCPWWWIVLLGQAIIQTAYYYLISKKEINDS